MNKCVQLLVWIVALEILGFISGYPKSLTTDLWYLEIVKSPLSPPSIVFPIAWIILYAMIAACGWKIWQPENKIGFTKIKLLYVLQLILNLSWTTIFFYMHWVLVGFFVIVAMIVLVGWLIKLTFSKRRICAYLLMPYFCWLIFAAYLNGYIWIFN